MNNKQTILIVDDTETNITILVNLLSGYDIAVATNGETALEICEDEDIDLILLDIMMPDMDGFEVCCRLKQNIKTKNIPIIFITARTDDESIEEAYDKGGIDYVTKPFKPKELLARVKTNLHVQSLINDLEYNASYDSLTDIYNRRKFFDLATQLFETDDKIFAVMLDIDNFKSINDRYGHAVGDIVLKEVTKTISSNLKASDIFGRLGGEEFAIISKEKNIEQMKESIEKIRYAIESLDIVMSNNEIINVTISSGVSQKDSTSKDIDDVLKKADEAMYEAKNSGKNKSIFTL